MPTDVFWAVGMTDWETLDSLMPQSPSDVAPNFLGRDDEDAYWAFYCRDGSTVVGPRPIDEILCLILAAHLEDDHFLFVVGGKQWTSVAEYIRLMEKEVPGYSSICNRMRVIAAETNESSTDQDIIPKLQEEYKWIRTGLSLGAMNPYVGGAYLGYKGAKRICKWLKLD